MKQIPSLWLMVLLLMLPQVVETIYSPALTAISASFAVPEHIAAQTLSSILRLLPLAWCVGAFYVIDGDADQPCFLG